MTSFAERIRTGWKPYALAVAATLAVLAVRVGLSSWFGDRMALVLFVVPILLSAYAGGMGSGLLATAVAAVSTNYYLTPPVHSFAINRPEDAVQWLVLLVVGVMVSVLARAQRSALRATGGTGPWATEHKVQVGFACVLGCMSVIGMVSFVSVQRLRESAARTAHTRRVVRSLGNLDAAILAAQSAQRGHTLIADQRYLDEFEAAAGQVGSELESLRSLTAGDSAQQRRLSELTPLVATRMTLAREVLGLRQTRGLDAAKESPAALQGNQVQNAIIARLAELAATEESLLRERNAHTDRSSKVAQAVIAGGGVLAFAFVAAALLFIREDFAGRRRAEAALRENNEHLEERVRERTAEWERQRDHLQLVLDTVPAMIFFKDRGHRLTMVNLEMVRVLGRPREELEGRTDAELGSPHAELYRRDEEEIIATGQPKRRVVEPLLTSHGERWLQTDKIPRRDDSGRIIGIIGFAVDITEQRQAAIATALLAAIVASSSDAIVGKDMDGIVTSWNAGAERVFGYTAGEMLGQPISRIIPDDRRGEEERVLASISSGVPVDHFETMRRRKDGALITVSVTVSPIRDASGKVVGASKMAHDITEAKRAAQTLRESEGRYRTLFEYSPDGILIADTQSIYLDANASMCRMLGRTRDELIGLHASDIVAQEELPHIGTALEVLRTDPGYQREWRFRRKDGTTFTADVVATRMPDGNLLAVIRDITEHKRAEMALKENEARLKTLFEHSPIAIWDEDFSAVGERFGRLRAAGVQDFRAHFEAHPEEVVRCAAGVKVREVNDTTLRMFQAPSKAAIITQLPTYFTAESLAVFREELVTLAGGGTYFESEIQLRIPHLGIRTMFITLAVVPGHERTLSLVLCSFRDITERKQLEEQLRQSQKMEAVGQLAGGVAHDFNNILGAILGNAELAGLEMSPEHPAQESIRHILSACDRARTLVRHLLAFSRPQGTDQRTTPLGPVVREALGLLRAMLPSTIELVTHMEPGCPPVFADASQIHQVLMNLCTNAAQALPGETGRIEIRLAAVEVDAEFARLVPSLSVGPHVRLTVTDDGTGMDLATRERIFEPFFTTKPPGQGTGLGLSVVHGIMQGHRGAITVTSGLGAGTEFQLWFPVAGAEAGPVLTAAGPEPTRSADRDA